ncbi:hypothetical protein B0T20DRAFT_502062 [Sordaria brevicollis]|uniref:Uncharacterized protein n=1 Tax=Sordaria brevicollis TaxID=83679 RepID=A0AAE0UAN8_SORBR|nr:hypothetical protein B0T20DRAFT_502062 [Sordaria brevicollis]
MSSNELKRGRPSRSLSPASGGQENKKPRFDNREEEEEIESALGNVQEDAGSLFVDVENHGHDKANVEAAPPALRQPAAGLPRFLNEANEEDSFGKSALSPVVDGGEAAEVGSPPAVGEMPLLLGPGSPVPVPVAVAAQAMQALPSAEAEGQASQPLPAASPASPVVSPAVSPVASPEVLVILGPVIDLTGDSDDEEERAPAPPVAPVIIDLTSDTDDEEEAGPPQHPPQPNANSARARSPRSPTPLPDRRIALWREERRPFPGECILEPPAEAAIIAHRACYSSLWANGVPQIIIFCDGSVSGTDGREINGTTGGYGVVLRNPWASNDNNLAVPGHSGRTQGSACSPVLSGFVWRSRFAVKSWSYSKMYSSSEAEAGAVAQSVLVALKLMEYYRPESAMIQIFTDSHEVWSRIKHGLNHKPWRLSVRHISPVMRAIVWMAYRLIGLGADLKIRWNPRRCAIGPDLADDAAGRHSEITRAEKLEFDQRNLPLRERDRILLSLHEEVGEAVRSREMFGPDEMPEVPVDWFHVGP